MYCSETAWFDTYFYVSESYKPTVEIVYWGLLAGFFCPRPADNLPIQGAAKRFHKSTYLVNSHWAGALSKQSRFPWLYLLYSRSTTISQHIKAGLRRDVVHGPGRTAYFPFQMASKYFFPFLTHQPFSQTASHLSSSVEHSTTSQHSQNLVAHLR